MTNNFDKVKMLWTTGPLFFPIVDVLWNSWLSMKDIF